MRWFCMAFDLGMALCFLALGLYFYRSQGRAWRWIAGYNSKSETERRTYKEVRLCRDYGAVILRWAIPFAAAVPVDAVCPGLGLGAAWLIFLILLGTHVTKMARNFEERYRW